MADQERASNVWAIIATGPSLHDDDVEYIRQARLDGRLQGVIGVNNAPFDKCPWADALVAFDSSFLLAYADEVEKFQGKVYSRHQLRKSIVFKPPMTSCNSGLLAMFVAKTVYKADRIILTGFDMGIAPDGKRHYFGDHTRKNRGITLKNTSEQRFRIHREQFRHFSGAEVINCSRVSALEIFPKAELRDIL